MPKDNSFPIIPGLNLDALPSSGLNIISQSSDWTESASSGSQSSSDSNSDLTDVSKGTLSVDSASKCSSNSTAHFSDDAAKFSSNASRVKLTPLGRVSRYSNASTVFQKTPQATPEQRAEFARRARAALDRMRGGLSKVGESPKLTKKPFDKYCAFNLPPKPGDRGYRGSKVSLTPISDSPKKAKRGLPPMTHDQPFNIYAASNLHLSRLAAIKNRYQSDKNHQQRLRDRRLSFSGGEHRSAPVSDTHYRCKT